jgi:3-deoxy-D-manno-octulosonic-acid transferase
MRGLMRGAHTLYTAALRTLLVGYAPVALARRRRVHLRERLGRFSAGPPPSPCGWVHAVSVGETVAAVPLIEGLRRRFPDLPLTITTVTETGARIARDRLGGIATHRYFPLDLPRPIDRVVDALQPRFLVVLETELWPNLFRALARRGVPIVLVNGRISDRSFRRYRWLGALMRRLLEPLAALAMQSAEDARRVIALGASPERVFITGNLKTEVAPYPSGTTAMWQRLLGLDERRPLWIAGSTHRGEEEAVLDAHAVAQAKVPGLSLLLAPRHPERVPDVERLIRSRGLTSVRRSALPCERDRNAVIVLDTIGELASLYGVGDVVFVGGSLVPIGGHNMLEPALRGKPVLFGPHTSNFREAADLLLGAGAGALVADAAELATVLVGLLEDPARRQRIGSAGQAAVAAQQGAVRETLDVIARVCAERV